MTNLLTYSLAVCAARHRIQVHAFCAMSTHVHLVVTDPYETLPAFLAQFHRLVALATKVLLGWEGAVWDHLPTSVVRLETEQVVAEKIAYVLANPVTAGLVRRSADWPGAMTHVDALGRSGPRAHRPDVYFDPRNRQWPDESVLQVALPAFVEDGEAARFRATVREAVDRYEHAARQDLAQRGTTVLGANRVSATSPYERAKSFEPTRSLDPTFAVGSVVGAYDRAVEALRAFRAAYRMALAAWRAGARDTVFPQGTWWMVRAHSVLVAT